MAARLALGLLVLLLWAALQAPIAREAASVQSPASAGSETLQALLEGYVANLNGSYGIATLSLDDGSTAFVNADQVFPAASMYKLLVMYRVFEQAETGELSLDDAVTITEEDMAQAVADEGLSPGDTVTVADALDAMITASSNVAAFALTRKVGGWQAVTSVADELGMYDTTAHDGEFWSTPIDMLTYFQRLAEGSLVSPTASDQMLDLLLRQTVNDRLPALLPEDARVAHKTGELPGVRNDGGIIQGSGGRYVIVVMAHSVDPDEAIPAEAEISRVVYDRHGSHHPSR